MVYNKFVLDSDMIYSIDFLQLDFCIGSLSDDMRDLLLHSFDTMRYLEFGKLDCSSGVKKLAKYDLHWWQFSHLHIEVWCKSMFRDIGGNICDEDGFETHKKVVVSEPVWFLRMKFNPNKCADNPAVKRVLRFLLQSGWVQGWQLSRIDYALDVQGDISGFYVLSRKTETNFGTTRYYGKRGTSGYLRVYDKRREQKEVQGEDIGFALTRFEWEQRGSRDLDFTFDQFSRMDLSGLDGAARTLRYVSPELINQALTEFHPNIRTKIRRKLFSPIAVRVDIFRDLVCDYVKDFGLSGIRVFTDAQRFSIENGELSPAAL